MTRVALGSAAEALQSDADAAAADEDVRQADSFVISSRHRPDYGPIDFPFKPVQQRKANRQGQRRTKKSRADVEARGQRAHQQMPQGQRAQKSHAIESGNSAAQLGWTAALHAAICRRGDQRQAEAQHIKRTGRERDGSSERYCSK